MDHMKGLAQPDPSSRKRKTGSRRIPIRVPTNGDQAWKKSRKATGQPSHGFSPSPMTGLTNGTLTTHDSSLTRDPIETSLEGIHTSQQPKPGLQSRKRADQANSCPAGTTRRASIFFDPVSPTHSLFQGPPEDPASAKMPHLPGIHIPRVKTPPPERRWPPHKRENWNGNIQDIQTARKGVPAKLKIPKPVPKVTHPEFFELSISSGKRNRKAPVTATANLDVPRSGGSMSELLHTYSQMVDQTDCLPPSKLTALPALNTSVKLPGNTTNDKDADRVAAIAKEPAHKTPSHGLKTMSWSDNYSHKHVQGLPNRTYTKPWLVEQVHTSSHIQVNSSFGRNDLQENMPARTFDEAKGEANEAVIGTNTERPGFLTGYPENAGFRKGVHVNQDQAHVSSGAVDKSRTLPFQDGSQKPSGEKGKSPRRVGDVDFTKETGSKLSLAPLDTEKGSPAGNSLDPKMVDQNSSSTFRGTPIARQLFPKRQAHEMDAVLTGDNSETVRLPVEASSEGIPLTGNIYAELPNSLADDFFRWSSECFSESNILTKHEEETVNSIMCDQPDLNCDELPDFDAIPEEFVDPQEVDWLRTDGQNIVPEATPSVPTATSLPVPKDQLQSNRREVRQHLMSTSSQDGMQAKALPSTARKAMHSTCVGSNQSTAAPGVLPGIAKKPSHKLMNPKRSAAMCSREEILKGPSAVHKSVPLKNCLSCKECFSCLCDSSIRRSHYKSCQKHKALNACFHCKFMFPSQKHLSDHILQKHPRSSITCNGVVKRIMSQTVPSQRANARDDRKSDHRCSVCSCSYATKSGLRLHLMKEHMDKILLMGLSGMEDGKQ